MKYNIYYLTTLKDDNKPMYVGVTSNTLLRRLSGHNSDAKKGQCKVHNWIKNRVNNGFKISIELIDTVEYDVFFWEDFYIDLFKSWGFILKNQLYSGYSIKNVNNKGHMSKECKTKLSKLYTNKKRSPDIIAKSVANRLKEAERRGYYHSKETIKKISKAKKGKKVSELERIRLKTIRGNRRTRSTNILALCLKSNKVYYYDAIIDFQKVHGLQHSNISKVLSGKRKSTGNFYFCKLNAICPIKTL